MEARYISQNDNAGGRPYRSHLQPACLSCRKRKSRCRTDETSTKCLSCQVHATACTFPRNDGKGRKKRSTRGTPATTTQTTVQHNETVDLDIGYNSNYDEETIPPSSNTTAHVFRGENFASDNTARYNPSLGGDDTSSSPMVALLGEAGNDTSHIVSPAIADDNEVLQSYLSTFPDCRSRFITQTSQHPSWPPHRPMRRVLFDTIPRRPLGVSAHQSVAWQKCNIIEKFLDQHIQELLSVFFTEANLCFPVFDKTAFQMSFSRHKQKLSPALLSNLYANAVTYWTKSPTLSLSRLPDRRFLWVQANEAMMSELFLSPGLSTMIAIILNICGRPSTSVFGNGGMLGMAVALSQALGLHRDPTNWSISPSEKSFRIRIWWLIVIHDRWCSLAYGTPLHINREQYDVPIPSTEHLCTPTSSSVEHTAASIFTALVTLTEVLGHLLQHIYRVAKTSPTPHHPEISITSLDTLLNHWEESLPGPIRQLITHGTNLNVPGAANLRLSYLAVKLLLRRIQLDIDHHSNTRHQHQHSHSEDSMSQPFIYSQRAAEDIVLFIKKLDPSHLHGFWIPVNAFALTSATTFLLRSALREENPVASASMRIAKDMITRLRELKRDYEWDMGDHCLGSCGEVIEKIEGRQQSGGAGAGGGAETGGGGIDGSVFQELMNSDSFLLDDFLFEPLGGGFDTGFWENV